MDRIGCDRLERFGSCVLREFGVAGSDADLVARTLVDAEARGNASHGMAHLLLYAQRLRDGFTRADAQVTTVADHGSMIVLDADFGLGQIAAARATDLAIERSAEHGIALVTVRNNTTFAAAAWYVERMALASRLGIAISNSGPIMSPAGGYLPLLGNSPFGVGIPTRKQVPLVLDMACSVTARGNIQLAELRGEAIPTGQAVDKRGYPTTDPSAALDGAVLPFGGYKGYGLALVLEMLSGILAGARMVPDSMPAGGYVRPEGRAQTFIAIDVTRFMSLAQFTDRSDAFLAQLLNSPPAPGTSAVRVPGLRAHREREDARRRGIALDTTTQAGLKKLGTSLSLTL